MPALSLRPPEEEEKNVSGFKLSIIYRARGRREGHHSGAQWDLHCTSPLRWKRLPRSHQKWIGGKGWKSYSGWSTVAWKRAEGRTIWVYWKGKSKWARRGWDVASQGRRKNTAWSFGGKNITTIIKSNQTLYFYTTHFIPRGNTMHNTIYKPQRERKTIQSVHHSQLKLCLTVKYHRSVWASGTNLAGTWALCCYLAWPTLCPEYDPTHQPSQLQTTYYVLLCLQRSQQTFLWRECKGGGWRRNTQSKCINAASIPLRSIINEAGRRWHVTCNVIHSYDKVANRTIFALVWSWIQG